MVWLVLSFAGREEVLLLKGFCSAKLHKAKEGPPDLDRDISESKKGLFITTQPKQSLNFHHHQCKGHIPS